MAKRILGNTRQKSDPASEKQSLLGTRKLVAFVATRNPDRAKEFYRDTLGLPLMSENEFALVFDAAGTMLRVTPVQELTVAKHTILGWQVPDILWTVKHLHKAHVALSRYPGMQQDEIGIWTSPSGAKIGWFKDPDGNTLSITQS